MSTSGLTEYGCHEFGDGEDDAHDEMEAELLEIGEDSFHVWSDDRLRFRPMVLLTDNL